MEGHAGEAGEVSTLNHCRDSGGSTPGASQGGARWNNTVACPTCGKQVRVTKTGRLWPHGTRAQTDSKVSNEQVTGLR